MSGFNPMGQQLHNIPSSASPSAMTPVTPSMSSQHIVGSVSPSSLSGPCGIQQQQQQQLGSGGAAAYGGCMTVGSAPGRAPSVGGTADYVDLSSLSPYNRHHPHHHHPAHHHQHAGSMAGPLSLGHNPMGPSATSVAMAATASHHHHHSYHHHHQSVVNGGHQYGMHHHHNSHNSTGINLINFKSLLDK